MVRHLPSKSIPLTKGQVAKVCECHYELVANRRWCFAGGYAVYSSYPIDSSHAKRVYMHREINNTPDGMLTDHIDRDKLNNCCWNLRDATPSLNNRNRDPGKSGFIGVSWRKKDRLWRATIRLNGE